MNKLDINIKVFGVMIYQTIEVNKLGPSQIKLK